MTTQDYGGLPLMMMEMATERDWIRFKMIILNGLILTEIPTEHQQAATIRMDGPKTVKSSVDVLGCPDYDGDGYKQWRSVPRFATQWNDSDWDGYGDNINGYQGDACPTVLGTSNRNETGAIIKEDVTLPVVQMMTLMDMRISSMIASTIMATLLIL